MKRQKTLWAGLAAALVLSLGALSCGGSRSDDMAVDRDTLTRAQKDSIIAEQPLPGASGVRKALDAAEKARERAEAHDTIH